MIRPATLEDNTRWIELMQRVQVSSDSWESAYLEKPSFSKNLDWVLEKEGSIIGILAGHNIFRPEGLLLSVEVLAIAPEIQGAGHGRQLIEFVSQKSTMGTPLIFWTCSDHARRWYEKMGIPLVEVSHLEIMPKDREEIWQIHKNNSMGKKLCAYGISCPWMP